MTESGETGDGREAQEEGHVCMLLLLLSRCSTDGSPPGSSASGKSPSKNTGMGCHFLLQPMKVKSESEVAQLCLTLSDPMDCSPPGSSVHGIFQARVLEWGAIAFSDHFLKAILIAVNSLGAYLGVS